MRVRKEVVREGTTVYRDRAGKLQSLTVTPELLKYWGDSGNAMRAANLRIPIPLEHDETANPLTPADRLRNNVGEVQNFELSEVEQDGVKKQALFSVCDIKDEQVQGKIKDGTINWSSPAFDSFDDPKSGKRWEGVITHLALTSRPRFTEQEPFQAQFSLTPTKPSAESPPTGFCLSRAGLVCEASHGTFKPVYPVAFSLWNGGKFSLEDMKGKEKKGDKEEGGGGEKAPKKEGKAEGKEGAEEAGEGEGGGSPFGKKGGDGEEGGAAKPKFDPMTGQPIKEPLVDQDGDISVWCMLGWLAEMALGVDLGEDISEENGLEKLIEIFQQAIKQKTSQQAAPPPEAPPEANAGAGAGTPNPVLQEQQPMYMSLTMTSEEAAKIPDPNVRTMALRMIESEKKTKALEQKAFKDAAEKRRRRVESVNRFIPEAKREGFLKRLEGARFSLSDDGAVHDEAEAWLADMEAIVAALPDLIKGGAQFSVAEQPEETRGGIPDARLAEVRKEFYGNVGIKVPQGA